MLKIKNHPLQSVSLIRFK